MSQDQHFRRIKKRLGIEIEGFIRAQEVTYGDNGWHPHFHMIVFTRIAPCPALFFNRLIARAGALPVLNPVFLNQTLTMVAPFRMVLVLLITSANGALRMK